jgi:hypothetical protein
MVMTLTPHDDTEFQTSGRRRKISKFALAGVAILGVGGALTSAAWSDNVFFGGTSSAADFELQGLDPATGGWFDADTDGASIVLPADAFDEVGPGIADSYTVQVKNAGDLPIYLQDPEVFSTGGALFAGDDPAVISFGEYDLEVLETDEIATLEVTVTGDTDWINSDYQELSGTLVIQIQGSSSAP